MPKELQERVLIEGCRRQHRESQLRLYKQYYSYAMGISLRYAKSREEASEMVNDGFLKLFAKIDQYDEDQPFLPWLRRIVVNAAIDYYRKYHKLDTPLDVVYMESYNKTTLNNALDNLAFDDLIKIMQKLPPAYQMVFNLYVVEGLQHQEIAERLNISVGSSKSNLSKARQKIKSMLGASHDIHLKSRGNGE